MGRNLDKIGMHSQDTAELFFTDVPCRPTNLLGDEGKGFTYLTANLAQERLSIAITGVATARAALGWTVEYVQERTAFGNSIGSFQNTKFVLAEVKTEVDVAQAYVDQCVLRLNAGTLTVVRRRAGQALVHRTPEPGRRPLSAAVRRLRLHERVSDRSCVRRLAGHSDLRRHIGSHEDDHRQVTRTLMQPEPGRLMASGRAADVYDLGDGTVLRRYRSDRDATVEGRVMTWVREQGIAVPTVHRAGGTDIVMDLVPGPTMLADLTARPWRVISHARLLARLQRSVNELRSPDWMPRCVGVPDAGVVVHLDLHPMNVILSPDGPTIIDWTNAASGAGSFDSSMSFLLMATFETSGLRDRVGQRVLVESFRWACGRSDVGRSLRAAADHRLADRNVTPGERQALHRLIDRSRSVGE